MRVFRSFIFSSFMIVSVFVPIHILPKLREEKTESFLPKSYKDGQGMVFGGRGGAGCYSPRKKLKHKLHLGIV